MHIKNFDPFDFKKKEINGVPVYYKNIPWAPCIHINIVFNTGALADEIGKEGTAHFLEHMTLKSSPLFPDKKDFWVWSKKYTFKTANAVTGYNYIYYTLKCLPENYKKVMNDLKDLIFNCYIREEEVSDERKIILQEAWRRFTNEKKLNFNKQVAENIFNGHPYSRFSGSLGWPDTISKITREDLVRYHKNNFGIGNFHIILVGNIENKNLNLIKDFVKDIQVLKNKRKSKKIFKIKNPLNNFIEKNATDIGLESEQVEIDISVTKEKIEENKRWIYAITRSILQELLFEKFRTEHNLCYDVNTYINFDKYIFSLGMNIKTDKDNISLIRLEFSKILEDFKTNKFESVFKDTKKVMLENQKIKEYLSGGIIGQARFFINVFNNVIRDKEDLQLLKKVEFKDVQKFIKDMFGDEKKVYTEIILPSKKENEKK